MLGAYEVLKKEPSLVDAFIPEGETINVSAGDYFGVLLRATS